MSLLYVLLTVLVFASSSYVAPSNTMSPCKAEDKACVLSVAKTVLKKLLEGDKALGTETLDPLILEEIDGALTILKYKMTNSNLSGYSKCQLKDITVDQSQSSFVMKMLCPHLVMKGNYDMDGKLIVLPVKGKGKYSIIIDDYELTVTATYKIVKSDGKEYFSIKSYQSDAVPKKGVKFEFENLFGGNKELASAVHKFTNEHWKDVCVQFQGPIIAGSMKKFVKNLNKLLKAMPMEKVFL